jgi:hypothetical protein
VKRQRRGSEEELEEAAVKRHEEEAVNQAMNQAMKKEAAERQ